MLNKQQYNDSVKVYYKELSNKQLNSKLVKEAVKIFGKIEASPSFSKLELVKYTDELTEKNKLKQVYKLNLADETYYLKRFLKKRFRFLLNLPGLFTGGVKSFKLLKKLSKAGIVVAEPVCALSYNRGLITLDTILITKEVESIDLLTYLKQNELSFSFRKELLLKLARWWAKLFNNKFLFKDSYLDNFLLSRKTDEIKFVLADVESVSQRPYLIKQDIIKTLARFNAALVEAMFESNTETITEKEIDFFYQEFFKYYNKKCNYQSYVKQINQATIDNLFDRGKANLVKIFKKKINN